MLYNVLVQASHGTSLPRFLAQGTYHSKGNLCHWCELDKVVVACRGVDDTDTLSTVSDAADEQSSDSPKGMLTCMAHNLPIRGPLDRHGVRSRHSPLCLCLR